MNYCNIFSNKLINFFKPLKIQLLNKISQIQMSNLYQQNIQVHQCTFQANIAEAFLNIKFPCTVFCSWKSPSNKVLTKSSKNVPIKDNKAEIDELIETQVLLLYDTTTEKYLKKQTALSVFLISKRKPDEEKLVGRVTIDLSEVINSGIFENMENHFLTFCSVKDGSLTFNLKVKSKEKTDMKHNELQMDSFSVVSFPSKAANLSMSSGTEDAFQFRRDQRQNGSQSPKYQINKINASTKSIPNDSQANQLLRQSQEQKIKLAQENQRFVQIINKNQQDMQNIREELNKAEQKIKLAQSNVQLLQSQKNTIIQELTKQVKAQTQDKLDLEQELEKVIEKLENRIRKVQKQYEQSEQIRLQNESEMLQIKFELSDLKTEKQAMEKYLSQKDEVIKKLSKEIEDAKKNMSVDQVSYTSEGISEKQRQTFNQQLQRLNKKVYKLQNELQFSQQTKQKMNEFNSAYNILYNQKLKLEEHIQAIQKDRDRFEQAKKELEEKLMKPGQSQMMEELECKISQVQNETDRFREEISNYQIQKQNLKATIEQLRESNSQAGEQVRRLSLEIEMKDNLVNEIENAFTQKNIQLNAIKDYIEKKDIKEQKTHGQITRLKQQIDKYKQTISNLQGKNKETQNKLRIVHKEMEEQHFLTSKQNQQINELNKIKGQLMNRNLQLENELKANQVKLSKARNDLKTKEQILNERKNTTMHLSTQMQQEIHKGQEYEERMMKLAQKQRKMRQNIMILEQETKKIMQAVIQKQENQEIQTHLIDQTKQQINRLQEEADKYKTQSQHKTLQIKTLTTALSMNQEKQLFSKVQSPQQTQQMLKTLYSGRIQELQNQINLLRQQMEMKEKEFSRQRDKLLSQRIVLEQKVNSINAQNDCLRKQKQEETQRCKWLQLNINQAQQREKDLMSNHTKEISSLTNKVQANNNQYNLLCKENERLRRDVEDYESTFSNQKNQINAYLQKIQQLQLSRYESSISGKSVQPMFNLQANKRQSNGDIFKENEILKINIANCEGMNKKLKIQLQKVHKQLKQSKNQSQESVKEINAQLISQFDKPLPIHQNNKRQKEIIPSQQLAAIYKDIKNVLEERSQKEKSQSVIELLINKNSLLEDSKNKVTEERGTIQETARKLSMQFQKIKSKIFKGKAQLTQRKIYLQSLKPCEGIVKDLINLAQSLSQVQFETQNYQ